MPIPCVNESPPHAVAGFLLRPGPPQFVAYRESTITIKGKGGKIRTVPINESIAIELKNLLAVTPRGHKLFVSDGVPTDIAIARLQQYIYQVHPKIQDEDSTRPMTHHGLRHSFAARTYQELIDGGMSPLGASLCVSKLLGHERPDVTRGYLAALPKSEYQPYSGHKNK